MSDVAVSIHDLVVEHYRKYPHPNDIVVRRFRGEGLTAKQLLEEITEDTEFGRDFVRQVARNVAMLRENNRIKDIINAACNLTHYTFMTKAAPKSRMTYDVTRHPQSVWA